MADKNKSGAQQKGAQQNQKPIKDLDARKDDGKNVKGGRGAVMSSDPQEGGE
jgi:hypothetical protein